MTVRNRDAISEANLALDALNSTDIARYRSGAWLAPDMRESPHAGETLEGLGETGRGLPRRPKGPGQRSGGRT